MAEGESNGTDEVTFTCISANPEGFYHEEDNFEYFETVDERAHNLFDGNTDSKWCFDFSQKAYVIFKASRLGAVSGYTITTGNDSGDYAGRNPKSWTLYGSNDQKNWTIIDQVSNDVVLQDENATAYNYNCSSSAEYEYFKWEITEGGSLLQVSELKLKLEKKICKEHQIQKIPAVEPTCTNVGHVEYYQCTACDLLFKDALGTEKYTDNSYILPAKGHQCDNVYCTVCKACALSYSVNDGKVTVEGFADGFFIPHLVIPETIEGMPVVAIDGTTAFCKSNIESVVFPTSLERIEWSQFAECSRLTSVSFAAEGNLKKIGRYAFQNCPLTCVSIPASVETIDDYAFKSNSSLTSVSFAAEGKLKKIGSYAFQYCPLTHVVIPSSVQEIAGNAFYDCKFLTSVSFAAEGKLKKIGSYAFQYCPLTHVVIPSSVQEIAGNAFYDCKFLTSVSFAAEGNLKKIGSYAFQGTALTHIDIPASVENIYEKAFAGGLMLEDVTFNRAMDNTSLANYSPEMFDDDFKLKNIYVPWKSKQSYTDLFTNQADKIKGFLTDNSGIVYEVNDDTHELSCIGTSDERWTGFAPPTELENMPVTEIKEKAFKDNKNLTSMEIPQTVKTVGAQAFAGCESLHTIKIKGNATTIAADAFKDTPDLGTILVSRDAYATYHEQGFEQCDKLVTLYGSEDVVQLTDEKGMSDEVASIPTVYAPNQLSYQRQGLEPDGYATLCLPFSISQYSSVFEKVYMPLGTVIHNTAKSTPELEHFILMLQELKPGTRIQAGQPVFVKLAGGIDKLTFTNDCGDEQLTADLKPKAEAMKVVDWDGASGLMTENDNFRITYGSRYQPMAQVSEDDHIWSFNGNGTFGPQKDGVMPPFRLFLTVLDATPSVQAKAYSISIGVSDGTTTGIREIISSDTIDSSKPAGSSSHAGIIYDLNGRKVATASKTKHMSKGIYILNGKKMVVK